MSKLIFNKCNKNLFKFRYYSTSKNTDDLFEIKKDEKKYNWINELNGNNDSNRKTNKRINKSVIDTLSFQKKQSSKNNEWESVSNKIKNKTLSEINRAQKSVLLDEHEQWQRTIIESLEKHQEDGKDLKRLDKLLTIKNALRPDLVDHEYYHNPQHIDELMSEERKREWRALKVHRIDAPKILNTIREHLGRGEKLPVELVKKAEQILKKPIFDELKQNGLLHEEYMDNLIMPEVEGREAIVDDEPKDDAPSIIHPEDLNNKLKDSTEDWFALEDNSINNPKKNCEFCFCKGVMPELHPMNVHLLLHFMSPGGRIMSRRHTGLCAKWQRKVSRTIRRAKNLGIFSYNKSKYYINFPFESPATTEYLNQKYQNLIPVLVDEEDAYKTVSEDEVQHTDEEVFSDEDEQRFKAENTNDVFSKIEQDVDRGRGMDGTDDEGLTGEEDEEDELLGGREEEEEEIGEDEEENQQNPDEEEDIGEGQEIIKDVEIYKKIHRRRSSKELDLRRSNNYDVIIDKLQK